TSNPELTAHFLQSTTVTVHETESLFENLPFPLGQRLEDIFNFFLKQHDRRHVARIFSALVLDKVTEVGFFTLADRRLQRDWLLRHFQHRADAIDRKQDLFGHFLRGWFAAIFLDQLFLHTHQL